MLEQAPDFFFLFTQPVVWAWETWFSVVWASQSTCKRHDLQQLWYLADGRLLFIFNLSNAERGTWKGWRTFAWMNWLSCGDTGFFFFNAYAEKERTRREGRQNSPLASQKLHPLRCMQKTDSVSVPRDTQKCEQEDWAAVSGSERIAPYRLDQSRVEAYTTGFSQTSIFTPSPFSGRTNGAQWRQGESKFLPCFSLLKHNVVSQIIFHGLQKGQIHPRKHQLSKKVFFLANNFGITTRGP